MKHFIPLKIFCDNAIFHEDNFQQGVFMKANYFIDYDNINETWIRHLHD